MASKKRESEWNGTHLRHLREVVDVSGCAAALYARLRQPCAPNFDGGSLDVQVKQMGELE